MHGEMHNKLKYFWCASNYLSRSVVSCDAHVVSIDFYFYKTFCFAVPEKTKVYEKWQPACLSVWSALLVVHHSYGILLLYHCFLSSSFFLSSLSRMLSPFYFFREVRMNKVFLVHTHPPPWRITVHSYHQSNETTIHIKQAR